MESGITFRDVTAEDKPWIEKLMSEEWGSPLIVSRGRIHNATELPGIVAVLDGNPAGLLTYIIQNENCEIVSLNSSAEGKGIGTGLIEEVIKRAKLSNCKRVWIITTNDNMAALRFYQKRGFSLAALYPNAIENSRKLKPQIPLKGNDDIPIRDEIELEIII